MRRKDFTTENTEGSSPLRSAGATKSRKPGRYRKGGTLNRVFDTAAAELADAWAGLKAGHYKEHETDGGTARVV